MKMAGEYISTLAKHESEIHSLGTRVGSVEHKLDQLGTQVTAGFAEIKEMFGRSEATKGPPVYDVLKIAAIGGTLIAMSAGAITVLVTSFVAPDLTKLAAKTDALQGYTEADKAEARAEYLALKHEKSENLDKRLQSLGDELDALRARFAWAPTVTGGK
jgi:predicted  nucleic acid-binding Zn-ribbon protein